MNNFCRCCPQRKLFFWRPKSVKSHICWCVIRDFICHIHHTLSMVFKTCGNFFTSTFCITATQRYSFTTREGLFYRQKQTWWLGFWSIVGNYFQDLCTDVKILCILVMIKLFYCDSGAGWNHSLVITLFIQINIISVIKMPNCDATSTY